MPKKDNKKKNKNEINVATQNKKINIVKKNKSANATFVDLTLFNKVLHSTEKVASIFESENH